MELTQLLDIVGKWSGNIVTICAALTAIGALIKPVREYFLKKIGKSAKEREKKLDEMRAEIREDINEIKEQAQSNREEIDVMMKRLDEKIDKVSHENNDNERDRIKREILGYEGMARQGKHFSEREFDGIRYDYQKYKEKLHGNGMVTEAYNYIVEYYNANAASWK